MLWSANDFLKCDGLLLRGPKGKRRRTDPHLKEAVISTALQDNRASKASSLVTALQLGTRSAGFAWMEEGLADLQAQSRLTFEKPHIVSLALDATAIGKPAKEQLLICQHMYPEAASVVLPPQELEQSSNR